MILQRSIQPQRHEIGHGGWTLETKEVGGLGVDLHAWISELSYLSGSIVKGYRGVENDVGDNIDQQCQNIIQAEYGNWAIRLLCSWVHQKQQGDGGAAKHRGGAINFSLKC